MIDLINGFSVMLYYVKDSGSAEHNNEIANMFSALLRQVPDYSGLTPNLVAMNFSMQQAAESEMTDLKTKIVRGRQQ